MLLVRQQHRGRYGDAQFRGQRVVEEFIVRAPLEWVVDHSRAGEHGVLQKRTVKGNVVRNAVDDHIVPARLRHVYAAHFQMLRHHSAHAERIDVATNAGGKDSSMP